MSLEEIVKMYEEGIDTGSSGIGRAFTPPNLHTLRLTKAAGIISELGVESMLDVGCGIGIVRQYLPRTMKYTGVDPVKSLIDEAIDNEWGGSFVVGTARDVQLKGGRYDIVTSLGVLAHIPSDGLVDFLLPICFASNRYILLESQHPDYYNGRFESHSMLELIEVVRDIDNSFSRVKIQMDIAADSTYILLMERT